jgi:hypothetical protein
MMNERHRKTYLFTLRIWSEPLEGNQGEWRGKLQALPHGEAYYFRGWPNLLAQLEGMLKSSGLEDDQLLIT